MTRTVRLIPAVVALGVMASCNAYKPDLQPEGPYWKDNDTRDIPEPEKRDPSLEWETVERTTFKQVEQLLDLNRTFRKIGGRPGQAWNINCVDEVPNSSWYTNRHHLQPMTTDELKRGYYVTGGPDKSGPWTVFRPKVGGATAGFWIKDSKGNQYILKFDPPNNPEMATSAAAMSGRLFYAAGYNVPEETITSFRPDELVIKEGVTWKDADGVKHPFTREKLNEILSLAYHNPDGTVRCLASLALPNIKGPFSFDGRRKDDPNDWCLHEHRRELRALYIFCSFVNHWDIKDQNSMDCYIDEGGRRFLKHHLLDFGSSMGSAGHGPQSAMSGYANAFDLRDAFVSMITLGAKKWQWEDAKPYQYPSVGYFESEIFHPAKWDPIYPIPAFENMTSRDAYWGAKVVMSLCDGDLRAIGDAGQLSDPEAREYMFNTLKARRDKIGQHWFSQVNPLDYFELEQTPHSLTLVYEDLALKHGLNNTATSRYEIRYRGKSVIRDRQLVSSPLTLSVGDLSDLVSAFTLGDESEYNLYEIRIETQRDGGDWSMPVIIWLWYDDDTANWRLVGVEHLD